MAKDPAVLWYWGDWNSGTSLFSRFLKGCYMDLLHAQFNNGRLSLEEIKTCLGSDFGQSWPTLQKKFEQDEKGLFFNERLEREKIKRVKYVDSRSKNKMGKTKSYEQSYDEHMKPHMENANEIGNATELGKGGAGGKPDDFLTWDAQETILANQIEFERICMGTGKTATGATESLRKYHLHLQDQDQYPKKKRSVFAGFEKWLMNEKQFQDGTHKQSNSNGSKPGTSAARNKAASEF